MNPDDHIRQLSPINRNVIDAYSATGTAVSIAANRISYVFNLSGPSLTIDTACSSALVALHYACHSIRSDECEMALVGGVNALLVPELFMSLSKLEMLSPDGRCKSFDQSANGYVRSEGAGIVVLKKLSKAIADGDRVYAVVKGSYCNSDGRREVILILWLL
jgi:acyl transferase domain-containing protein